MPSFVHESLLWWGLPLVALPVLIHLINLMRHRRVKWAAMEFLLASQKRHQKSIRFKQWLLLLLRMLAVAAAVLMVAQPLVRNRLGGLLGGSKTHHILLLDDSFSMADRWADTNAFDQAKQVVARLAAQAGHQDTPQMFTLLRFSQAGRLASGAQPDLAEEPLDADFDKRLEEVLGPLGVSETAADAREALAAVERMSVPGPDENRVVYLVSDFRALTWQEPAALAQALARLDQGGAKIHLIDCVDAVHSNLAISALRPGAGTRAAGVPLLVEVSVRNFGPGKKDRVSVSLEEDGHPRPAIVIEEIPAGRTVTRRFPVLFTTAGEHEITARLETDAVDVDNTRALVIDVPKVVDVLVIDGDAKATDAFFLSSALAPGGKTTSGLKPLVESPRYLRDHALDQFETIYLLNVARLEDAAVQALEAFVKAGGGLGIFVGELTRAEFVNEQLYRGGQGLFPLPLAGPAELAVDRLEKSPDLEVTDHPIFAVFAGERNSFLNLVVVNRYFAAEKNWSPAPESSTRVIARLRNKAPLAVEHALGDGRVVAILTKASPAETSLGSWNNWGRDNPSYVVAMLELQSYLSSPRHPDTSRVVGTPLQVQLDPARYLPQVHFVLPRETPAGKLTVDAIAAADAHIAVLTDTFRSGIYQVQLTGTDGTPKVERFVFNVLSDEGDLRRIEHDQLAGRLPGVRYEYHRSGDINYNPQQLAGFNLSESLLYALIAVLLVESVLAYACSYHPPAKEGDALMATDVLLAQMATRTSYELGRFQSFTERWHFLVLAVVSAAIVAFAVWMYRRDSVELRPGIGGLLLGLRLVSLLGLLAFYLQLEKRTERKVVHNSRVLMLVDTSLSMGLHDATASAVPARPNRLEQVVEVLSDGRLVDKLREKHDVAVARFDAELAELASLGKLPVQAAPQAKTEPSAAPEPTSAADAASKTDSPSGDWSAALRPQGTETRLGQALRQWINDQRSAPISGVVVFSDGGQNSGVDPSAAILAAREAKIPIFAVGVGSDRRPANVRISDLVAPARAYPDDSFHVTGYLQSDGLADRTVAVELVSRAAGEAGKNAEEKLEGTERVTLGGRGEVVPVKFEITASAMGRRMYRLRVKAPPEDSNSADDAQEVDVEVVDRKTKVLLIASGPTREYIFLGNQLQRATSAGGARQDKDAIVDVWLQSAGEGISQDAHEILTEFPSTAQELFEYDCIVAFDPDWRALNSADVDLLERWVAEKAGGLIVVAGPVEMDRWVQDAKLAKIRALYPVEFNRRISLAEEGRFGSTTPWPIEFTREGLEAEFLWLADSGPASSQVWASFPGVFGYYGVRGAKPGATVFGRYSDPEAAVGDQRPVYMAGQFYGAGRVFYLGSGEMWRLRALDDRYFEQFYTKLIRYVSQGRLLLGSSRGMLLVDRDRYLLGNTVVVRAQLSTAQFEPLELPSVTLKVIRPDSTSEDLQLAADPARKGMYVGQFTALAEGSYRLEMDVSGGESEQLTRRIQVRVPDLERENPERNDALLSEISRQTGGMYYVGADAVLGSRGMPPLVNQLPDRTEVTYLAGVTDREFDERWTRGLLIVIAGALCLEWLIRRLSKLA